MALKGHTKIELTNVNTGEVETYEDDNMVTNALEDLFHPLGFCGNQAIISDRLLYDNNNQVNSDRLLHTATGGLLLFDKSLEPKPELTTLPGGVSMTGHACYRKYTGADKTFGSYNDNESGLLYDGYGYKHVWDFQTNQANGKISCACLTTALGGFMGTGSHPECNDYVAATTGYEANFPGYKGIRVSESHDKMPVYFDGSKNELLLLKNATNPSYFPPNNLFQNHINHMPTSFLKTGNLIFEKRHYPFSNLSIFDFSMKDKSIPMLKDNIIVHLKEIENILPEEALKLATIGSNRYCFNYKIYEDEGYLFFVLSFCIMGIAKTTSYNCISKSIQPDEELCHIWKININSFETEKYYKVINTTGLPVWLPWNTSEESVTGAGYWSFENIFYTPIASRGCAACTAMFITSDNQLKAGYETCLNPFILSSKNLICLCGVSGTSGGANGSFQYVSINFEDQSQISFIINEGDQNNENGSATMEWYAPIYFSYHMVHNNKAYFSWHYPHNNEKIKTIDLVNNTFGFINTSFENLGIYTHSNKEVSYPSGLFGKVRGIKENIFTQCGHIGANAGHWMRMFFMPNMLITINNLPQTITKTNDQTMKVTYTLVDDSYEVD